VSRRPRKVTHVLPSGEFPTPPRPRPLLHVASTWRACARGAQSSQDTRGGLAGGVGRGDGSAHTKLAKRTLSLLRDRSEIDRRTGEIAILPRISRDKPPDSILLPSLVECRDRSSLHGRLALSSEGGRRLHLTSTSTWPQEDRTQPSCHVAKEDMHVSLGSDAVSFRRKMAGVLAAPHNLIRP
jgi:hypothetical protein